ANDKTGEKQSEDGRQIKDTSNLFAVNPPAPSVTAEVELSRDDFYESLTALDTGVPAAKVWTASLRKLKTPPRRVSITRRLDTLSYYIPSGPLADSQWGAQLADKIIESCPYVSFPGRQTVESRLLRVRSGHAEVEIQ